ncbi:MAG: hypothetical protein ABJN26_19100 [Stappiaceae bacterium]
MIKRSELDGAVGKGILTAGQADALSVFLNAPSPGQPQMHDPEEVRFSRGFHDVFITIGIVCLFAGMVYGLHHVLSETLIARGLVYGLCCLVIWLLAEWFSKRQRLALPSIVLSLLFFLSAGELGFQLFETLRPDGGFHGSFVRGMILGVSGSSHGYFAGIVSATLAIAVFYLRFRVPIAVAGIAGGIVLGFMLLLEGVIPRSVSANPELFFLISGLVCFASAMSFDARDTRRETNNSDKAFWLHLLAAPLIVHSVLNTFIDGSGSAGSAAIVIGLVALLGFVALIVDRRALLVSGLGYFGYAVVSLLQRAEIDTSGSIAASLFILGLFVLMLGSGWNGARSLVLSPLANTPLTKFVPPVRK